jgi:hypothetical protein
VPFGLSELRGRDVLYVEYRLQRSDKWAFLTATDVVKAGTVELRVYVKVLSDTQDKKIAMSRLEAVLAEFGTTLTAKPVGTVPEKSHESPPAPGLTDEPKN